MSLKQKLRTLYKQEAEVEVRLTQEIGGADYYVLSKEGANPAYLFLEACPVLFTDKGDSIHRVGGDDCPYHEAGGCGNEWADYFSDGSTRCRECKHGYSPSELVQVSTWYEIAADVEEAP
jgi:hypothetical protein